MTRLGFVARLSLAILCVLALQVGGAPAIAYRPTVAWPPYHWPIRPFDSMHPVRAAFGDPRTLAENEPFGMTGPGVPGAHSFHNGIDIAARPGTAVYPVVSGRVVTRGRNEIIVLTDDGRSFQYEHLKRVVHQGQLVVAQRTVLGWIQPEPCHVHLAEIDYGRVQNPLAPGHLEPYRDKTRPRATALYIDNGRPRPIVGGRLGARNRLVVAATDQPARPVSGPWDDLPQAPALVEWRLFHSSTDTGWQVAADFRQTEPPPPDFWKIYAPGTFQNCPVFARHLYAGTPGRYLFHLRLELAHRAGGGYRLEVRVADIRGNSSTASWPFRLVLGGRP